MAKEISIVKIDTFGNVKKVEVMEIPDGIGVNPGDIITEKGNCIIIERKNSSLFDIYLINRGTNTLVEEVLKNFQINTHSGIKYYADKAVFLTGNEWDNQLINLNSGKVIAEGTKKCRFYGVKEVVTPIQGYENFYILKYSSCRTEKYILIDKDGNRVLPSKFVGKYKKIESSEGIGNILLLKYIDISKNKTGMLSVRIQGDRYFVDQIINRNYDYVYVDYDNFVIDRNGIPQYPCIEAAFTDASQKKVIHYYNVLGKRIL